MPGTGNALGSFDEKVQHELSRFFHHRVAPFGKELTVAAKSIVLHELPRQPRRSHRPDAVNTIGRHRFAIDVGQVMDDPTVRSVKAFGGFLSEGNQRFYIVEIGQVAFGKIRGLHRPVVHLKVNVDVVVGVPRCFVVLTPLAL